VNIFIEYYYYNNKERDLEITEAINKNCKFPFVNKIFCFGPKNTLNYLFDDNKICKVEKEERCTFQSLFDYSNTLNYSGVSCIMNNDIILSDDFKDISLKITIDDFYCISRREINKSFSPIIAKWSQDLWCWFGNTRIKNCNFYFGVPGNDNTIPYHAEMAGYSVKNPSLSFKCYHNHKSNYRIYKMEDRLDRQFYREVVPCYA
jgi:hypothetical protein